jgi:Arc/MetJ-type ribon-helix-helix transcriptional regulator
MRRNCNAPTSRKAWTMKTASLPSLRVDPELREAAESVLQDGESLSSFIEASVRETIERRRIRTEFIARGLASREESRRTGIYYSVDDVRARLDEKLAKAKKRIHG